MWTPSDFKAVQNGTSVSLSWSQPMNNISGFKLTKKVDTGAAADMTPQSKGITTLVDPTLTGGKLHTYTLVSYAGNNQSNVVTATVTPVLVAGGISTTPAASITAISVTSGGTITTDGGSPITARGVCWATTSSPTTAGSKTTDGTGSGTFTSPITGLTANTLYYVRAYAINSVGTTYGNEVSFRTLAGISTITTTNVTNIAAFTATSGGNITADGGAAITARGVCWATTANPTIAGSKTTDGTEIGTFSSALTNLTPNTTYYVRTYSTNSTGTTYGTEVSFKTLTGIPTLTTASITNITSSTATSGGTITDDGGSAITARGVCWGTTTNPIITGSKTTDGTGTGTFTSSLTGLIAGSTYYLRVYATNSLGTYYGNQIQFNTSINITTSGVINVSFNAAIVGGSIPSVGNIVIAKRGVCYSQNTSPTINNSYINIGSGQGSFNYTVAGLIPNSAYYARAFASNGIDTYYGNEISFKTSLAPSGSATTTDLDGNYYNTITIGNQVWMAENLKTTLYSDGTAIPNVIDNSTWGVVNSAAYCWYSNDASSYKNAYGALYNWWAVNTGKLAPIGWHIPTSDEWLTLINFLGSNVVSAKIKMQFGWDMNVGTNESGFSLLPAGFRASDNGSYQHAGYAYNYWLFSVNPTATGVATGYVLTDWTGGLLMVSGQSVNDVGLKMGKSVRCIKNQSPTVSTNSMSNILSTSVTSGGIILSDGGTAITARGVCWSTTQNPTIANTKTNDGAGVGSFASTITGLAGGTTYYVKAYATNSAGTAYGSEVSFKTLQNTVVTAGPDATICSGNIFTVTGATASNYTSMLWTTSGTGIFSYDNIISPTYSPSSTDQIVGTVTLKLTCTGSTTVSDMMVLNIQKIPSAAGTISGFSTVCQGQNSVAYSIPAISNATSYLWSYSGTGATITGASNTITVNFSSSAVSGILTVRGVNACGNGTSSSSFPIPINPLPSDASPIAGLGTVTQGQSGVAYSVPAISNSSGYSWTVPSGAIIASGSNTNTIIVNYSSSSISGNISVRGTNSCGNGATSSFPITVYSSSTNVTDADGNVYSTVTIGTQVWMASNLKVTKYKDGTAIPLVADNTAWSALSTPGYCWYNNDATINKNTYGALYNWYTVNTGKLCPVGWHVPSNPEWTLLTNLLGGVEVAGDKLKEIGVVHWTGSNNIRATNETGFTFLPAGWRKDVGTFGMIGSAGYIWNSTQYSTNLAVSVLISDSYAYNYNTDKLFGFSVRCIKD